MSTIEDRLHSDAGLEAATPDWDAVVARAGERAEKQKMMFRAAAGVFALLVGVVWILGGGTGPVETIQTPGLAQPAPSDFLNAGPWSEPSPVRIMAAWFLAWGGSIIVGGLTFFFSAPHFRAPYIFARTPRVVAVGSAVALWNAALVVGAIVLGVSETMTFVSALYPQARWGFIGGFIVMSWSAAATEQIGRTVLYFLGFSILAGVLGGLVPPIGVEGSRFVSLAAALVFAVLIGHTFRQLGFEFDQSRLSTLGTLSWKRFAGAVLVIGGLVTALVALAPTVVFAEQVSAIAPSFREEISRPPSAVHPLSMEQSITFLREFEDTQSQRTTPTTLRYLLSEGFEQLSENRLTRPRGDAFEAINITRQSNQFFLNSQATFEFSAESTRPFEVGRVVRNAGLAITLAGLLLWWSETAISRFLVGSTPWRRQRRSFEWLGWVFVWGAALGPFAAIARIDFLVFIGLAVVAWLVGVVLLVPKPPKESRNA